MVPVSRRYNHTSFYMFAITNKPIICGAVVNSNNFRVIYLRTEIYIVLCKIYKYDITPKITLFYCKRVNHLLVWSLHFILKSLFFVLLRLVRNTYCIGTAALRFHNMLPPFVSKYFVCLLRLDLTSIKKKINYATQYIDIVYRFCSIKINYTSHICTSWRYTHHYQISLTDLPLK